MYTRAGSVAVGVRPASAIVVGGSVVVVVAVVVVVDDAVGAVGATVSVDDAAGTDDTFANDWSSFPPSSDSAPALPT